MLDMFRICMIEACPGYVLDLARAYLVYFRRNDWGTYVWICFGHVLDMFWMCVLYMFWTCVRHVSDLFCTCVARTLEII